MNRLSWDTTAPRRPTGRQTNPQPRAEDALLAEEADLIRVAWDRRQRTSWF
jgi:hypothetical protein